MGFLADALVVKLAVVIFRGKWDWVGPSFCSPEPSAAMWNLVSLASPPICWLLCFVDCSLGCLVQPLSEVAHRPVYLKLAWASNGGSMMGVVDHPGNGGSCSRIQPLPLKTDPAFLLLQRVVWACDGVWGVCMWYVRHLVLGLGVLDLGDQVVKGRATNPFP